MPGQQGGDRWQRQQAAGRRIRVRKNDAAVGCHVVVDTDRKTFIQGHRRISDLVQTAVDRIEAVGDVGKENRSFVLEQRHEHMRQHFIRAVADEDLLRRDAEIGKARGNGFLEAIGARIRVQAQPFAAVHQLFDNRREHARGWRIGILVGVQLDQLGQLRLLARNIRRQAMNKGTPVAAHERRLSSDAREA
jgi:hypothetical protein